MQYLQRGQSAIRYIIWLALLSVTVVGGYQYWQYSELFPSTDDAYVQAHNINISAEVTGRIAAIHISDHQTVTTGTLLFEIDPTPFQLAAEQAQAQLALTQQNVSAAQAAVKSAAAVVAERQAALDVASKNAQRIIPLVDEGRLPQSEGDDVIGKAKEAKAGLEVAQQELEQAKQKLGQIGPDNADIKNAQAALAKAELDLKHTKVFAPADGTINNLDLRKGSTVTAYQPLFNLIEENSWWVDANYKETDLKRIQTGQTATIELDMYPGHKFTGTVQSISRGSGAAFSLLPPENASGNWVKVTQRFPVKILLQDSDPHYPLRVGASSDVSIDTTTANEQPPAMWTALLAWWKNS